MRPWLNLRVTTSALDKALPSSASLWSSSMSSFSKSSHASSVSSASFRSTSSSTEHSESGFELGTISYIPPNSLCLITRSLYPTETDHLVHTTKLIVSHHTVAVPNRNGPSRTYHQTHCVASHGRCTQQKRTISYIPPNSLCCITRSLYQTETDHLVHTTKLIVSHHTVAVPNRNGPSRTYHQTHCVASHGHCTKQKRTISYIPPNSLCRITRSLYPTETDHLVHTTKLIVSHHKVAVPNRNGPSRTYHQTHCVASQGRCTQQKRTISYIPPNSLCRITRSLYPTERPSRTYHQTHCVASHGHCTQQKRTISYIPPNSLCRITRSLYPTETDHLVHTTKLIVSHHTVTVPNRNGPSRTYHQTHCVASHGRCNQQKRTISYIPPNSLCRITRSLYPTETDHLVHTTKLIVSHHTVAVPNRKTISYIPPNSLCLITRSLYPTETDHLVHTTELIVSHHTVAVPNRNGPSRTYHQTHCVASHGRCTQQKRTISYIPPNSLCRITRSLYPTETDHLVHTTELIVSHHTVTVPNRDGPSRTYHQTHCVASHGHCTKQKRTISYIPPNSLCRITRSLYPTETDHLVHTTKLIVSHHTVAVPNRNGPSRTYHQTHCVASHGRCTQQKRTISYIPPNSLCRITRSLYPTETDHLVHTTKLIVSHHTVAVPNRNGPSRTYHQTHCVASHGRCTQQKRTISYIPPNSLCRITRSLYPTETDHLVHTTKLIVSHHTVAVPNRNGPSRTYHQTHCVASHGRCTQQKRTISYIPPNSLCRITRSLYPTETDHLVHTTKLIVSHHTVTVPNRNGPSRTYHRTHCVASHGRCTQQKRTISYIPPNSLCRITRSLYPTETDHLVHTTKLIVSHHTVAVPNRNGPSRTYHRTHCVASHGHCTKQRRTISYIPPNSLCRITRSLYQTETDHLIHTTKLIVLHHTVAVPNRNTPNSLCRITRSLYPTETHQTHCVASHGRCTKQKRTKLIVSHHTVAVPNRNAPNSLCRITRSLYPTETHQTHCVASHGRCTKQKRTKLIVSHHTVTVPNRNTSNSLCRITRSLYQTETHQTHCVASHGHCTKQKRIVLLNSHPKLCCTG